MAKLKDHLAQVGMGAVVAGLKAAEKSISKKQYKRLIATAVAQLLTMHPDYGVGKARRRARKVTGAKPSKKVLVSASRTALKKGLESAAVAAASGVALKAATSLGRKVTDKVQGAVAAHANGDSTRDP
jgi:hypothetical protein